MLGVGGYERCRFVHIILRGHLVHPDRAGKNHTPDAVAPGCLEDVSRGQDVDLGRLDGVFQHVVDVRHGRQHVDGVIAAGEGEARLGEVSDVDIDMLDVLAVGFHDIEDRHFMAGVNELVDHVGADESGTADDTDVH